VAGGRDIDARIERHGSLDLRTQGTVPVADRLYDPRKLRVRTAEAIAELERRPRQPASLPRTAALAVWRRVPERGRARLRPAARRARALRR
jgi:hypothetical protein